MFLDEPFDPETVEQQIASLQQRVQDKHAQPQAPNLRLIQQVQQLYQTCQTDSEGVNHAYQRLLQHGDHGTILTDRKMGSFGNTASNPRSGKTGNRSRKRPFWHPRLIAAVLLIGVLLTGTFVFALSRLSVPSSAQRTPSPTTSQNSAALNIPFEPQPLLYQNTLYVNSGSDIRAYTAQNGAFERTYPLADVENPAILDGVLYASNTTSTFALRLSDGKLLWQAPFGLATPPIIVNGILYASTETPDNIVYALQANDGKVLWQYRFDTQDEIPSAPLVIQNVVYFSSSLQLHQTIDARIYALKATNGSLLWQHSLGHTAISNVRTDGSAFYVFVDGSVEAFSANGRAIWRSRLPFSSLVDMQNTFLPAVSSGMIYVKGGNGAIYALRATDGVLLWSYQATSRTLFGLFSIQGNILYVGISPVSAPNTRSVRASLLALRTSDGHLLWQRQLAMQEVLNPTAGQGRIYVVYGTGTSGTEILAAFQATNGLPLWTRTLASSF